MNPLTYFMSLKTSAKITLMVCFTVVVSLFMLFAYYSGVFDLLVRRICGSEV